MRINQYKKIMKNQKGSAMLIAVFFFMFVGVAIVTAVIQPVVRDYQVASDTVTSRLSYFTAESGLEDAMYRVKNSMTIGTSETLTLNGATVTTSITDTGTNQKQIVSSSDLNNRDRSITAVVQTSVGISFNYGVQVGQGGLDMQSSTVNGNVYANGPISGDSSSYITGTAISANSPAVASDQSNGSGTPAYDVIFGNTNSTQDIAQSFQVSTDTSPLNKVSLYIKKVSTPSNATVKIVTDASGSPSSTVVATGTLSASTVSTSYGWIDVSFSSNPMLDTGTTYWLVIDAGTSSTKYYVIGANSAGYANGIAKSGTSASVWSATSPSGLDLFFNLYLGGVYGTIYGSSGSQYNRFNVGSGGSGTAQAHTVNYANVTGNIYCQSGTGNNKSCTSQSDPSYQSFPISDANISDWKDAASAGGTSSGNYSVGWAGATLGPKKINGNLTVSGGGTLTVTGPLWVTGNISLSGGGTIRLSSSYGSNDGVIVADGTLSVTGGSYATGSGTSGSYILVVALSSSTSAAAQIEGGSGAMVVYAPNGTLNLEGGASLKEATAYKVHIEGGSTLTYETGLANLNFTSGASGSWSVNSWNETQ